MGTTIMPVQSGGPEDEGHLRFVSEQPARLRESGDKKQVEASEWSGVPAKKFMDNAMGCHNARKTKASVKKGKAETIEVGVKSKKLGPFGEKYEPVKASNPGVRSKESLGQKLAAFGRRLREYGVKGMKWGEHHSEKEFLDLADKVGKAHNATRRQEDAHIAAGEYDKANELYDKAKANVKAVLDSHGISPKEFDHLMNKLATKHGKRTNVKMARMFRNEESAPPGREDQVKALKKTDVDNPYAVAWSSYNKS